MYLTIINQFNSDIVPGGKYIFACKMKRWMFWRKKYSTPFTSMTYTQCSFCFLYMVTLRYGCKYLADITRSKTIHCNMRNNCFRNFLKWKYSTQSFRTYWIGVDVYDLGWTTVVWEPKKGGQYITFWLTHSSQ